MTHTTRADKAFEILNQNEDDNVDLVEFAKAIPKFEAIGVLSHDWAAEFAVWVMQVYNEDKEGLDTMDLADMIHGEPLKPSNSLEDLEAR